MEARAARECAAQGQLGRSGDDLATSDVLDGVEADRGFTDPVSGKTIQRPALSALLGFVRDGDTVLVHSMDRMARNLDDLRRLVRELTGRGVRVEFVSERRHDDPTRSGRRV
jgi:DNA invertase Pin-like site-specific DNA recombinase